MIASRVGTTLRDAETGEALGKAIVLSWKGRIHLIGLTAPVPLRPIAVSTPRLTYWKTTLGFAAAKEPDYPNIR
jgi:hypothetical protein